MDSLILLCFGAALTWRLGSVVLSRSNERVIRAAGGKEYGVLNNRLMTGLHTLFYFGSLAESFQRGAQVDQLTLWGAGLYLFSMIVLVIVWYELGELWTIKLYIAPNHFLNESWLFRHVRHPNYFLSILPELVGLALILKAWIVPLVVAPFYAVVLVVRIRQEERVMREHFADY